MAAAGRKGADDYEPTEEKKNMRKKYQYQKKESETG